MLWGRKKLTRGALCSVAVAAVLVAGVSPASAAADDYPTWEEVEQARADEHAAEQQVAAIHTALETAQQKAATVSVAAQQAERMATQARDDADRAEATVNALGQSRDEAADRAADVTTGIGAVAAQRYRSEAAAPTGVRVLTASNPDDLLADLGRWDRISATWSNLYRDARVTHDVAASLNDQAEAARAEYDRLAAEAERAAAQAQTALETEAATVADLNGRIATMYEQLAVLNNTTAELERLWWIGQNIDDDENDGGGQQHPDAPQPADPPAPQPEPSPDPAPNPGPGDVIVDPAAAQAYARGAIGAYGWGGGQFDCLVWLWNRESGWRADAENPYSGAYGIPQALPGEKMASAGADWRTNGRTQIDWGLSYISTVYGTPCAAWQHSEDVGWY
ncbi:coiled-coil domain-containing protein [Microbacterium sp. YY-01]|uniref:coiled-coil domain-containing protein n=1 Tax=Microbacterium sp. YY-01 TaxID=3421634 RepID=UPI003D1726C5